jgi:isoquinoline 1-oxidoreductase beta subunit
VLNIKPEQVKVVTTYAGGGFGRRAAQDFVIDAVLASKAAGAPVQLVYSREDDMRSLHYRPAALGRLSAELSGAGTIDGLSGRIVCSSAYGGAGYDQVFRGALDPGSVEGLADIVYKVDNLVVDWVRHEPGVQVFTWRSVGQSFVIFFVESFIDELAHAAGADPLSYRLDLLREKPEHRRVLEKVATDIGWGQSVPEGHGIGFAVCEDRGYPIALGLEASMNGEKITVHRMVSCLDCGFAINPALVRAQVESSLVFGLSATLDGEITIRKGQVQQGNFDDYPVLRMDECPPIAVHVLDSAKPPGGVGEIAVPLVAPALCNALFAATGRRLRSLPLRGRT